MKIYRKDKTYVSFPPMIDGQDSWLIGAATVITAEEAEQMNTEARGYVRTLARLEASRARRKVESLK